ncbi:MULTISPECIES: anti-sigma factor [unclassified Mesorhizobium]|uniref:anti-sigma factor family protein n=1 Tax=unclassified Mesorhizobium TaxID=325217 RepID=UPI0003CE7F57|nr:MULTISPECIES: anti-sigma factor [unclassified Mesorhizobium]ESX29907.1 anti-sigma factor [Mesorhizobium sp. LSHC440B00]ESX35168.1 anti-sigma factor [Mesorhizobium sp. LSHC432A00]ESX41383.1 anti-sigma factor [Mesorhizobium sp. LSHC440A00]WJI55127.1 anti-sigma factor [Mesorhizobium sp. C432A]
MSAHNDGLPEDAAGMNLMLHALVDGELDAAAAIAVERRIAADPKLAAEHARIIVLQGAVARLPKPRVSDEFSARIAAMAASSRVEVLRPRAPIRAKSARTWWSARNFGSFDWRAMAASIMISAVLASGATQWAMQPSVADSFAAGVASGHQRSLLATSPVDVVSSDRHTVKPWLDARLGLSPPAPDMAKDGFALIGGRVEVIGGRAVPALVYRHREHLITLVAEPQNAGVVTDPVDLSEGGFSLVQWSDGAFSYWAISDMERPEIDDFVARFRAAIVTG